MFEPSYDGEIAGYVVNHLKVNYWRIERTVGYDDAKQEAYCAFLKCRDRYQVEDPRHFMALFKTMWHNRFTDLANEDTLHRTAIYYGRDDPADGSQALEQVGETDNAGYLRTLVRQAPPQVSMVLSLFLNAPTELLEAALSGWRPGGDRRMKSGGSRQINRLLGLPEDQDTLKDVTEYFS